MSQGGICNRCGKVRRHAVFDSAWLAIVARWLSACVGNPVVACYSCPAAHACLSACTHSHPSLTCVFLWHHRLASLLRAAGPLVCARSMATSLGIAAWAPSATAVGGKGTWCVAWDWVETSGAGRVRGLSPQGLPLTSPCATYGTRAQAWQCKVGMTCDKCGKKGHRFADCTKGVICHRCGQEGHFAKDCKCECQRRCRCPVRRGSPFRGCLPHSCPVHAALLQVPRG